MISKKSRKPQKSVKKQRSKEAEKQRSKETEIKKRVQFPNEIALLLPR